MKNLKTYEEFLDEDKKYTVDKSSIEGEGIFATQDIKKGEFIGMPISDEKKFEDFISTRSDEFDTRTDIGRKLNHKTEGNSVLKSENNNLNLYANSDIKKGDEITVNYKDSPWYVSKDTTGFSENLKTYEEFLNERSMSIDDAQSVVDRVYPQIVKDLGKSKYVGTPKVELHKDIYARVSGIEDMEGEDSKTSEAEYESHVNTIYIYYPNMKNEKHIIQSLLHEYTHSLQDQDKRKENRKKGYDKDPDEIAAHKAEKNWKKYIK